MAINQNLLRNHRLNLVIIWKENRF